MNIDLKQYTTPCVCGREHSLLTREILIEAGAINRLEGIVRSLELDNRGCVVCDTNTRPYARRAAQVLAVHLLDGKSIVELNANGLHADEKATAALSAALPDNTGWLLAVGSGTIHDTTRYIANQRGIPFVSFPTAATVDGFVSTVSAMTWHGFKTTLPGVSPLAVVADTDIFAAAPYHLTAAGIGDVLGKYTSLCDWEIGHLVTGEDFCPRIAAITRAAADNVRDNLAAIRAGSPEDLEKLMFALLLSGIGIQMWGTSRPASGAEHHLSHLWEMEILNPRLDALHGEKVGVGLGLALTEYKRVAALPEIRMKSDYTGLPLDLIEEKFGRLSPEVVKENTPDPLAEVDPVKLQAALPRVRQLLAALPDPEDIAGEMQQAGCHTRLSQIGLPDSIVHDSLSLSPFVRYRLTFMRLRKLLDI